MLVDWKDSFPFRGIYMWRNILRVPNCLRERRYLLKHGFTREAEYDMPLWFIRTMTRVMEQYRKKRVGIPGGYTNEEWDALVGKMIENLENMRVSTLFDQAPDDLSILEKDMWANEKADKHKDEFFDLFKEVFYLLWD